MRDLVIIGGGPAGLSAACLARDRGMDVVMLYTELGGRYGWRARQIRAATHWDDAGLVDVASTELVRHLIQGATTASNCIIRDHVCAIHRVNSHFRITCQTYHPLEAATVIVATGTRERRLDLPEAERFVTYGFGYTPRTYVQRVAGRRVAVVGATSRTLRGTMEIAHVAEQVYLITSAGSSLASPLGQAVRAQRNVEVLEDYQVTTVIGGDQLVEIVVAQGTETRRLRVTHALADLGEAPNTELVRDLPITNPEGFIVVDERNATRTPGLFAAGDVTSGSSKHILGAADGGARAALSAYDYVLARTEIPVIHRHATPSG